MVQDSNSADEALRKRLVEIARRYPQAEIARRTGTTPSNVSRYLRGNRIPGAFLTGLCSEFGVNPGWLLLGQGATWAADVGEEQGGTSGRLLDMVNAMTRIGRLRLGALGGKSEARSLHELNDALEVFERERRRLGDESRDVYARLLEDWGSALQRGDLDAIRHLRAAAEQVARLCPDENLELRYISYAAMHDQIQYRFEDALRGRRRLFLAQLGSSEGMDEKSFRAAFGLVATLDSMALIREGVRYAEAAFALAPQEELPTWESYASALGLWGWGLVQLGELERGVGKLTRALALDKTERGQANIRVGLGWVHYTTGAAGLAEVAAFARGHPQALRQLLMLSAWSLDALEVQGLLKQFRAVAQDGETSEDEHVAVIHLAALQGRKAAALKELDRAEAAAKDVGRHQYAVHFAVAVLRTQVHRLLGQHAQARRALTRAEKARHEVPAEVTIELNWLRTHWRNAAALADAGTAAGKRILGESDEFVAWARRRGFQTHAS